MNQNQIKQQRGIYQEELKLIACVSMLIDHVGAVLYPQIRLLRVIGRIAFPIFCFLLAEGSYYTHNPKKYAVRLSIGMLLSELPFDFAFFGGWTWQHQSVMVTLLLGFLALETMKKTEKTGLKILAALPFALAAEFACTDYGGDGVMLIAMFGIVRGMPHENLLQFLGMLVICGMMNSAHISIWGIRISIELFAVLAIFPICGYSGRKRTEGKALQWAFYLFYPVHIGIIWILSIL